MATAKILSNDNLHKMINLLMSIKSESAEQIDKCISVWTADTTYKKDSVVLVLEGNQYSEYCCDTTHISKATFEEDKTYWTLVSCVDFEGYTEEELLAMLNLSQEELDNLQNIINNEEIQTDHVWSSSKVYAELLTVLSESKKFTIAEVAKIVSFSYKVVTSEDDVVDDKAIYLIENASGTHDMYLLIDGSPSKVGNTSIDLSDYLKKENIVDTFDETTIYVDSDKVFSTKASKSMYDDLNDKKISKSNIVTTLDDTVTDEQVVGALTVRELTKDKNIKTYTDISQLGLTDVTDLTAIATELPENSCLVQFISNQPSFPKVYGTLIVLKKRYDNIIFKFYPNEDNEANAEYRCGYHPNTGLTNWVKTCTEENKYLDIMITEDNVETYMDGKDILTLPIGKFYLPKAVFAKTLINLPSDTTGFAGNIIVTSITSAKDNSKGALFRYPWIYRTFIYIDMNGDSWIRTIYVGNTIGEFEFDTGWRKICTTSVSESSTNVSDKVDSSIAINNGVYCTIKNGYCTINFNDVKPITSGYELILMPDNSIPKSVNYVSYNHLVNWTDNTTILIKPTKTGSLLLWNTDTTVNSSYYGSITYPILES